jgi:hypothetical protein
MSIMDHFRSPPPSQAAAPTPNAGAAPVVANPTAPTTPPTSVDPSVTPLEPFAKIWENDPNYKAPGSDPIFAPSNPKALLEAAQSLDFSSMIPQELMARIANGGQEAQLALTEALKITGSHVYAQNAHATTEIVKQALAAQEKNLIAKLPLYLKNNTITNSLEQLNPALSHPATAPYVKQVQEQMQMKFPNATPQEITKQVSNYFDAIGKITNGKPAADAALAAANAGEDWEKFLTQ